MAGTLTASFGSVRSSDKSIIVKFQDRFSVYGLVIRAVERLALEHWPVALGFNRFLGVIFHPNAHLGNPSVKSVLWRYNLLPWHIKCLKDRD